MQHRRLVLPLAFGWLLLNVLSRVLAAEVSISVDVARPAHAISPRLYGTFFEDINFGGDGGLSAEMVKNGSLEFPQPLMGWREQGAGGAERQAKVARVAEVLDDDPAFPVNPHYLRSNASTADGSAVVNEGFRGMGLRAGERYLFSAHARSAGGDGASLRVTLISADGQEVVLKVVNPTAEATAVDVDLRGVGDVESRGQAIVLHGGPEEENSLAEPNKIVPESEPLEVSAPKFRHTFPPYSLTIVRLKVN